MKIWFSKSEFISTKHLSFFKNDINEAKLVLGMLHDNCRVQMYLYQGRDTLRLNLYPAGQISVKTGLFEATKLAFAGRTFTPPDLYPWDCQNSNKVTSTVRAF